MFNEDEIRKPKSAHVVGEDLSSLSIEELGERITVLQDEIKRIEAARAAKQASMQAANSIFR